MCIKLQPCIIYIYIETYKYIYTHICRYKHTCCQNFAQRACNLEFVASIWPTTASLESPCCLTRKKQVEPTNQPSNIGGGIWVPNQYKTQWIRQFIFVLLMVEVGSWNPIFYGFIHPNGGWEWDFWTINSIMEPTNQSNNQHIKSKKINGLII